MIVTRSLTDLKFDPKTIITVGTFDGVHLGHRSIIKELVRRAKMCGCRSVVITFEPHPREIVGKGPVPLLTTQSERIEIMNQLGVDIILVINFTFEFSRQSSRDFYERYIIKGVGVKEVIVGHDHTLGRDRLSGIQEIRSIGNEYGFNVDVIEPVTIDGEQISSTKIRKLLALGNVELAAKYLGYLYSLNGIVVEGDRRGVTLGFPTANIDQIETKKELPADGVYCVQLQLGERQFAGMMNIGVRPTFQVEGKRIIEVNLFDLNENIYGKEVQIQFIRRIRSEKKFSTVKELIDQLHRDRSECMKCISESQPNLV